MNWPLGLFRLWMALACMGLLFLCIFVAALHSKRHPGPGISPSLSKQQGVTSSTQLPWEWMKTKFTVKAKNFHGSIFQRWHFHFSQLKIWTIQSDEDVYDEIFDQWGTPDRLAVKCHLSFTTSFITFLKMIFTRWSFQNFQFFWIMKLFGRDDVSKIYLDKLLANRRWRIVKLNCLIGDRIKCIYKIVIVI